ncbi:hypothetical protein [Xanthomonas phage XPP8]|nr:hypothetical protein [Xanthomonas phage XPP3]AVO23891.1 hypothetical protein [Xanthomonas phage XPP4]AVO24000.1 hypothetical protein [Xanthomonas phage XPP6]AVO24021.1 hypothetical protein [Xanthomonas phage XPP8]
MAVVVFDPTAFKLVYPEFVAVPDARLTALFNLVGYTILDNTDASVIVDPLRRAPLLDLLVAHMLALFGYVNADGSITPGAGTVGRVANASEGSVSTSLAYSTPSGAGEAWFSQTPYGAMYWAMSAPFRSFHYVAAGLSGVGYSQDYLSTFAGVETRLGNNSGTPNGV